MVKTPYSGLYEVFIAGQLIYTDDSANYLIQGSIIDAKNDRNLTEERTRELLRVKFDELPLASAIKTVKGNGKRRLAVFSDPDCPFCKELEVQLKSVTVVTVYTFLFPIAELHPDATQKANAIWCAADQPKT